MDFNSDRRFAPQQNISCKMNIMTDFFGLGVSKAGYHRRTLIISLRGIMRDIGIDNALGVAEALW